MIIKRIVQNLQRRNRAGRFAVRFSRLKDLKVPKEILIAQKKTKLDFPNEKGVWSAFVEIFLEDGYCLGELSNEKIDTIIDVGANIGFFSLCARHYFPQAEIIAYEPNHHLEKYLSLHLRQAAVKYFLEAVGKEDGMISLQFNDGDSIMTTTVTDANASVKQRSFASVLQDAGGSIDLLKLDCEGAEWQILEDQISMRKVKWLVMEYHLFGRPNSKEEDIVSLVRSNGFTIKKMRTDKGFGFILAKREL